MSEAHDKFLEERCRQRANVARHLHSAITNLQTAASINRAFELGLDVPATAPVQEALDRLAAAHQKETQKI